MAPLPKPSGPPPAVLAYALCLVPITAFAGWVVTYGQDEEALEEKLRAKYGNEINQVESKKSQMSELYMATIKNPGSSEEQEKRLQQVLRGGKGDVKRHHAIDTKYYGTDEGLVAQKKNAEEMQEHQDEERKKMKKIKKRLKKLKKQREEQGEADGDASVSEEESELEEELKRYKKRKKAAAAAGSAFASATGSSKVNPDKVSLGEAPLAVRRDKSKSKNKDEKEESSGVDMQQVVTLTAVAGAAALVGFLAGGGSRRQ